MKLLTKAIIKKTPKRYSQENVKDPLVTAKFFCPWSGWDWYLIELDEDGDTCFGYVHGFDGELGYFSIKELESITQFYLHIERDRYFEPKKLSEIKKGE